MSDIRVRIAPAPSGFLHIGTAKMALFNWLFARKYGGAFILRLEDTDAERTDEQYVEAMGEGFRWLGLDWDEGPAFAGAPEKGAYGPYRQSQRKQFHQREGRRLLEEGKAYKCFCTREELDAMRERAKQEKRPPRYSGKCANLTPQQIAAKGDAPYSVRLRVPREGQTVVEDLVQGTIGTANSEFDDFIIVKPNGDPTFHLAVVVDDAHMRISHVIRGDDHLTNTVRHVLLFNALGYSLPVFAHLPMVLDEHGKKYSKRMHGANVLDWRADGYLPEALINYVALLGWTPAEEGRELFTRQELIDAFTEDRLGRSAAKFDLKKLRWLNGQHIRRLPVEEFRRRVLPILERAGFDVSSRETVWLTRMAEICQEKVGTLNEIVAYTDFFFVEPEEFEEKAVRKHWRQDTAIARLAGLREAIASVEPWSAEGLKQAFESLSEAEGVSLGQYVHPARLALTGKSVGPGLFELAELLGRDACVARIGKAMAHVQTLGETPGE